MSPTRREAVRTLLAAPLLPWAASHASAAPAEKGVFVAVGYGGRRMVSADGVAWEITAEWGEKGGDDSNNLMGLAFGKGKFVAVGGGGWSKETQAGHVLVSADGRAWKEVKKLPFRVNPVLFGNDRFVAGGPDRKLWWSADGEEWTQGPQIEYKGPGWAFWFRRGAAGNGLFVMVGNAGNGQKENWCVVTKDGEAVTHAAFDLPPVRDIAFGNGRFVVVGPDGLRLSSTDGKTWEHEAKDPGNGLGHVCWTGTEFLATGGKTAFASAHGVTWKAWPKPVPCAVLGAANGVLVGTSWPGRMWSSGDGLTWAKGKPMTDNGINAIAYGVLGGKG